MMKNPCYLQASLSPSRPRELVKLIDLSWAPRQKEALGRWAICAQTHEESGIIQSSAFPNSQLYSKQEEGGGRDGRERTA